MNPSSIRFVPEALLLGVHMQMTLEVLHKDLKSDEHIGEVVLFFPQKSAVAMLSGGRPSMPILQLL